MSFEPNDNMNTIHLGNYEEFFILYMDNELSREQVKMVDAFLAAHPDLKAELDILMSAKLPPEEFSFDKNDLLAESMKLSSVNEELLLYVDNELPAGKRKMVELELASNKDYQLQYQGLLQTKLDPSEKIAYPNKKELYHETERRIAFRPWMRVAAAAVVIASAAVLYFSNKTPDPSIPPVARTNTPNEQSRDSLVPKTNLPGDKISQDVAANPSPDRSNQTANDTERKPEKIVPPKEDNPMAFDQPVKKVEEELITEKKTVINHTSGLGKTSEVVSTNLNEGFLNSENVTYHSEQRNTINAVNPEGAIATNDRKGSVKGFLRKATRMIEKRTGFDPTNDDGALLIGAVAINLK